MKIAIWILLAAVLLTACAPQTPVPTQTESGTRETQNPTRQTQALPWITPQTSGGEILLKVWQSYPAENQFSIFGGSMENPAEDVPGDLNMAKPQELADRFLFPEEHLEEVKSGASMVHLMNGTIFTGAIVELSQDAVYQETAKQWEENIQKNFWICGHPDKLLIARVDGHLVMAYGLEDPVEVFREMLQQSYSQTQVLVYEAIRA